jgi:hypothetical protein
MTKDEALTKAAEQFDRLYTDSIRKLVTDLCVAGQSVDAIADIVAQAVEQQDARETFMQNVVAGLDEHVPEAQRGDVIH